MYKYRFGQTCSSAKNIVRGNDPVLIRANCARFFYAGEPINLFNQLLARSEVCAQIESNKLLERIARPANLSELVNGSIYLIMDPFSGCAIKQARNPQHISRAVIKT
jgi:hypothetical protein